MSSIINIELPQNCYECMLSQKSVDGKRVCYAINTLAVDVEDCVEERPVYCPLMKFGNGQYKDCDKLMKDLQMCVKYFPHNDTPQDNMDRTNNTIYEFATKALKVIEELYSLERKQGEWLRGDCWWEGCGMGEIYGHYYKCSVCGKRVKEGYKKCDMSFCPNCGADMRGKCET